MGEAVLKRRPGNPANVPGQPPASIPPEAARKGQFGYGQSQYQGSSAHLAPEVEPEVPAEAAPAKPEQTDLEAMRRVIGRPKKDDRTPKEKNFRAVLENYPHSFLKAKAELERQEREDRLGAAAGADAGSARVRAAVERLRKAHKEKAWGAKE